MPCPRIYMPGGGSGGGGGGTSPTDNGIEVRLHDAYNTTLPATDATLIDGQTVVTGDLVLFTNLAVDNNTIQSAAVDGGGNITWTIETLFTGSLSTPSDLDRVSVREGDEFANNFFYWSDEASVFNNLVNSKNSLTIPAVTINGEIVSLNTAFYKYATIKYSMIKGTKVAAGTLWVISNGASSYLNDDRRLDPSAINAVFNSVMVGATMKIRISVPDAGSDLILNQTIEVW